MKRKILIKNRRNHNECLELTLEEFKAKFENELKRQLIPIRFKKNIKTSCHLSLKQLQITSKIFTTTCVGISTTMLQRNIILLNNYVSE